MWFVSDESMHAYDCRPLESYQSSIALSILFFLVSLRLPL